MSTRKNTKTGDSWENIKMRSSLVEKLRENKAINYVPIMKFVEIAVKEKLERMSKNKSPK